jgi:membrane-bound lytic murein transglycosylase B
MPAARSGNGKSFSGNPRLTHFINQMVTKHGFNRAKLTTLFTQVKHETWISNYMNRQRPARKKPNPNGAGWSKYRVKFVKASKINKGVQFWRQNEAALQRASQRYGVPAEYIVSIIGVETNYGNNFGKFRVIDALTTIGLTNKRRGKSFLKYLEDFLLMTRKEGMNPLRPIGSHAGAMGYGQFMPSSFLNYAVDFDGNGVRDLWHPTDAIGSIANYFKKHGWRSGEAVTVRTRATGKRYRSLNSGFKTNYSATTLASHDVKTNTAVKHSGRTSLLVLPTHAGGEIWLGYNNFYVISRYNHSTYYSMAVHQLAQAIKKQHGR